MFGKYMFGETMFGYGVESGSWTVNSYIPRYRLVLFDSDGTTTLYYLPIPVDASWYRKVSEPSELTLKYDSTTAAGAALTIGRYIKLYDETDNMLDAFRISHIVKSLDSSMVSLTAEGLLAELADQFINEATYPASGGWTLKGVVNDLLDEQEDAPITLTLLYLAPSLASEHITNRTYKRQSILEILQNLVSEFGGFLMCNGKGEIRWFATATDWRNQAYRFDYTGQYTHYLRAGKDLISATVTEDRSRMATRLYAIGVHEGIHLAAPGYIEDATAKSAYGLIPRFAQNIEAETRTELTRWAEKVLEWVKYPRYEIDLVALDKTQLPESTDYHHIHLGHLIKVDLPDQDICIEGLIFELTVDLFRPERVQIGLSAQNYGTGIPEVSGLSQQPYPLFSKGLADTIGSVINVSKFPYARKGRSGVWLRYEA